MRIGHPLGLHRVLEPAGALPQAASRLDNTSELYHNEILVDVELINITSASFSRLKKEVGGDENALAEAIVQIVARQGKYQDPVLGSGGVLIGRVAELGSKIAAERPLVVGDLIATLVSLTGTPLLIERVLRINMATDQVWVQGRAIIFEKGLYARLPDDLPREVSVAVMDVAGAPAMVAKKVFAGQNVLVLGGGKAGLLCLHEAKKRAGVTGRVVAVRYSPQRCREIMDLGLADQVLAVDVTRPVEVMAAVEKATDGRMADFTVDVVNVENSEMAAVLSTRDEGQIFFYNTATSFTKAALGAESVGKPVEMLIGNGYVPGHAELAFQIMRENEALRKYFQRTYAGA